jgi:hypothetical protein
MLMIALTMKLGVVDFKGQVAVVSVLLALSHVGFVLYRAVPCRSVRFARGATSLTRAESMVYLGMGCLPG